MNTQKTLSAPKSEETSITEPNQSQVPWINIVHSPRLDARLHKARQSLPYQSAFLKESFSDELWQAMEQRGLNQAQFAEKADVSKQFLTKVFRGGNCTMETIAKLVFALNFRAHIHLTPNEVGCEWIHQVPWTIPQSFNAYTDFFIGTKYHSVNRIEKEMDYAAVTSDS